MSNSGLFSADIDELSKNNSFTNKVLNTRPSKTATPLPTVRTQKDTKDGHKDLVCVIRVSGHQMAACN